LECVFYTTNNINSFNGIMTVLNKLLFTIAVIVRGYLIKSHNHEKDCKLSIQKSTHSYTGIQIFVNGGSEH